MSWRLPRLAIACRDDDAVKSGIARASRTLRGVSGAWVKERKVGGEDGKVTEFQANLMVTFVLDD